MWVLAKWRAGDRSEDGLGRGLGSASLTEYRNTAISYGAVLTTGRCQVTSGDRHSKYSRPGVRRGATYRKTLARTVPQIGLALLVREMREDAALTQAEIAKKVGTTQSVIARLEDPEYTGHSLTMLERIAAACGVALKLRAQKKPSFEREVALV